MVTFILYIEYASDWQQLTTLPVLNSREREGKKCHLRIYKRCFAAKPLEVVICSARIVLKQTFVIMLSVSKKFKEYKC
jgi:hypothetical protein